MFLNVRECSWMFVNVHKFFVLFLFQSSRKFAEMLKISEEMIFLERCRKVNWKGHQRFKSYFFVISQKAMPSKAPTGSWSRSRRAPGASAPNPRAQATLAGITCKFSHMQLHVFSHVITCKKIWLHERHAKFGWNLKTFCTYPKFLPTCWNFLRNSDKV